MEFGRHLHGKCTVLRVMLATTDSAMIVASHIISHRHISAVAGPDHIITPCFQYVQPTRYSSHSHLSQLQLQRSYLLKVLSSREINSVTVLQSLTLVLALINIALSQQP